MFDEDKIPSFYIPNFRKECIRECVIVLNDEKLTTGPLKTITQDEEVIEKPAEENSQKVTYEGIPPGTILWASLSKKATLWPSILIEGSSTEKATPQYHVKFFNDSGRSAWVSVLNTLEFTGKDESIQRSRHTQKSKWEAAIAEAEEFLQIPLAERLQIFTDLVKTQ
uniref:Uncharacterized protein n=1 Tax=Phlebotomus papatasi TaxID=29031 RepID=A0A1B0DB54_PHLPP